jgi:hypothetical protein
MSELGNESEVGVLAAIPIRKRPPWLRWLYRIGLTVLIVVLSGAGVYLYNRQQNLKRLEEAIERLDQEEPGWQLEQIEAARAQVPDAANGAHCVLAARKTLPRGWKGTDDDGFLVQLPANVRLGEELATLLEKDWRAGKEARTEALRVIERETGRYPIEYNRLIISTLLPHAESMRFITRQLRRDACYHLERFDPKVALLCCRAMINVGRSIGDEPFAISQLVRIACVGESCRTINRVLGQAEVSEADLLAVQKQLEKEDRYNGFLVSMRGERAALHHLLTFIESGEVSMTELAETRKPKWWEGATDFIARDRFRAEHTVMLSLFRWQIEIAQKPLHERGEAQDAWEAEINRIGRTPMTLLLPAASKIEARDRSHHAQLRCTVAGLAAERYRLKHKTWPNKLEDVQELVDIKLVDPCVGKPMRMRHVPEGLVIYSVGVDGIDDGGNIDPRGGPGTDEGIRLWNLDQRRSPPLPWMPPVPLPWDDGGPPGGPPPGPP